MNRKKTIAGLLCILFSVIPLFGQEADGDSGGEEEESKVVLPGAVFELENGQRVNLRVRDNNFRLFLYPEEGKDPEELPYRLATLRYDGPRIEREFVRLTPSENGEYLTSHHLVQKPYNFHIWLFLYEEGVEEAATKTKIRFRQDP